MLDAVCEETGRNVSVNAQLYKLMHLLDTVIEGNVKEIAVVSSRLSRCLIKVKSKVKLSRNTPWRPIGL
jgi:hypothetical protein